MAEKHQEHKRTHEEDEEWMAKVDDPNRERRPVSNILIICKLFFDFVNIKRKTITEMIKQSQEQEQQLPYKLNVPITFQSTYLSSTNTSEELWANLKDALANSMFRGEFIGLIGERDKTAEQRKIFNFEDHLEPDTYKALIKTNLMDQETLEDTLQNAMENLRTKRPLFHEVVVKLEAQLLLTRFTHASLVQEGSTITLSETELLAERLSEQDPLHKLEDSEMSQLVGITQSSDVEVVEAVNHLQVVQLLLKDFISGVKQINEVNVLELHRHLMDRLLTDANEGMPGK